MDWLVPLVVVLVVLLAVGAVLKARFREPGGYPYINSRVLFSPAERSFLGALDQAVGREYRIFGKVRVADIVEPRQGLDRSNRQKALNRTLAKHFDFVLCAQGDLTVACAIELDDRSHQTNRRRERDTFLAALCRAVSLPLLQIPAQRTYSVPGLRQQVLEAIAADRRDPGVWTEPSRDSVAEEAVNATAIDWQASASAPATVADASPTPSCPRCAAPMVRRQAKAGPTAGQPFWGCSTFPKCRGIVPMNT